MTDTRLTHDDVEARLVEIPGWGISAGSLHRELEFADFREAFGFMAMVALAAERLDHHPTWTNTWNRVVIDIASHAAGGITERCLQLAREVNRALGE